MPTPATLPSTPEFTPALAVAAADGQRLNPWSDPNAIAAALRRCVHITCIRRLHALALKSGVAAVRFAANHLLLSYFHFEQVSDACKVFALISKPNTMSSNILINGFLKNGHLDSARSHFHAMRNRNPESWNAMITGLTDAGFDEESLHLFLRMREKNLRPDEYTLGSALRACSGLRDIVSGRQLHSLVSKLGWEFDMCVGSSLGNMYMRCGESKNGEAVIAELPFTNIVISNTIIAGRALNDNAEGAIHWFGVTMKAAGVMPNEVTFVGVVSACADLAAMVQGQQVHAQIVRSGVGADVSILTSLVNMYSRCGSLCDSWKAFSDYAGRSDLLLTSAMITACGFHGHGDEAIRLFNEMINDGVQPTEVTFLSLLYACSHSGLKDEGMKLFSLMERTYGLKPGVKHYTCIVDLLGRSGSLIEAEALILSMPVVADAIIWKTLLSACKTHKNAQMAERVAKRLIELNPWDSASYVLRSNVHAIYQRWPGATEVRKVMWEKKVKKEPAISWVEYRGQMHQFCTSNKSHPRQDEIDNKLKELIDKIKLHGYAPDTANVLHDMEEEDKELALAQHSEKIAIAFALITLPPVAPIRVLKNLRACEDCHVFFKLISKVTRREIVVRDTSRFHHFSNGECSCRDYW